MIANVHFRPEDPVKGFILDKENIPKEYLDCGAIRYTPEGALFDNELLDKRVGCFAKEGDFMLVTECHNTLSKYSLHCIKNWKDYIYKENA